MRYLILGAGAIGGTLGGHLHRAGREALLIARPAHAAAIDAHGLRLVTGDAEYRLDVPAVDSVAAAAPFRGDDVVLLTCKAQHTAAIAGCARRGRRRCFPSCAARTPSGTSPTHNGCSPMSTAPWCSCRGASSIPAR